MKKQHLWDLLDCKSLADKEKKKKKTNNNTKQTHKTPNKTNKKAGKASAGKNKVCFRKLAVKTGTKV